MKKESIKNTTYNNFLHKLFTKLSKQWLTPIPKWLNEERHQKVSFTTNKAHPVFSRFFYSFLSKWSKFQNKHKRVLFHINFLIWSKRFGCHPMRTSWTSQKETCHLPKQTKKPKINCWMTTQSGWECGNQFFLILAWAIPFYYIITRIFPQAASQAEVLILEAWGPVWIGFLGVINIFFSKA